MTIQEEWIRNFIGMPECEVNLGCERTRERRERERFNFFKVDHGDLVDRSKKWIYSGRRSIDRRSDRRLDQHWPTLKVSSLGTFAGSLNLPFGTSIWIMTIHGHDCLNQDDRTDGYPDWEGQWHHWPKGYLCKNDMLSDLITPFTPSSLTRLLIHAKLVGPF